MSAIGVDEDVVGHVECNKDAIRVQYGCNKVRPLTAR